LAHLCLGAGNEAIAIPYFRQPRRRSRRRNWRNGGARDVAYPLSLFYQCLVKTDGSSDERERLYTWICRLDPLEAMKLEK